MVNANVVISISAVLVALILTIVIVMRQTGDPAENYSVAVTGKYAKGADNWDTAMYFCTGADCQFYGQVITENFPGYYALVGFTVGADTFVTEHSIGKTFKFTGGALQSCTDSQDLDVSALSDRVTEMTNAWGGGKTFNIDGGVFTLETYAMNADPAKDTPSVLGHAVPSVEECSIANGDTNPVKPAHVANIEFDASAASPDTGVPGGRRLWGGGDNHNAHTLSDLASFGYSGSAPGGWTHWTTCEYSNSVARFAYAYPTMILSWAGTNDMWDALQDMKTWGNANYHGGFWDYVGQSKDCVNNYVNLLRGWGIEIDYVTGHSLGGAAAVVYKQNSNVGGRVVTFGAPKTSRYGGCETGGTRVFNAKDPVASNGLGIMSSFSHDVSGARRAYESSYCSGSFWGVCYSWGTSYATTTVGCSEEAGGCSWFFDCLNNVGKHSLSYYQKHSLGNFGV